MGQHNKHRILLKDDSIAERFSSIEEYRMYILKEASNFRCSRCGCKVERAGYCKKCRREKYREYSDLINSSPTLLKKRREKFNKWYKKSKEKVC